MVWLEAYSPDGFFLEGVPVCDRLTERKISRFMGGFSEETVFFVARKKGNARIRRAPLSPILAEEMASAMPLAAFHDVLIGGADSFHDGMSGIFRVMAPVGWHPAREGLTPFIVRACGDIEPCFDEIAFHGRNLLSPMLDWRNELAELKINPADFPARRRLERLLSRIGEVSSFLAGRR